MAAHAADKRLFELTQDPRSKLPVAKQPVRHMHGGSRAGFADQNLFAVVGVKPSGNTVRQSMPDLQRAHKDKRGTSKRDGSRIVYNELIVPAKPRDDVRGSVLENARRSLQLPARLPSATHQRYQHYQHLMGHDDADTHYLEGTLTQREAMMKRGNTGDMQDAPTRASSSGAIRQLEGPKASFESAGSHPQKDRRAPTAAEREAHQQFLFQQWQQKEQAWQQRQMQQVAQQMGAHQMGVNQNPRQQQQQQLPRDTLRRRVSPDPSSNNREVRFRQVVTNSDHSTKHQNDTASEQQSDEGQCAQRPSGSSGNRRSLPIAVMMKRTTAKNSASSSGASSPETISQSRSEVPARPARLGGPCSEEGSKKAAEGDKEKARRGPSEKPTVARAGQVKVDISKAHSVFYVPCLKKVAKQLKFIELICAKANDPSVDVYWHDQLHHPITKYHICRLGAGQHMNRFIHMQNLARKNTLAKRLQRMRALFPRDYNFVPPTWRFPQEVVSFKKNSLKVDADTGGPLYYILKPDNGSKGQGIKLAEHARVLKTWAHMSAGASAQAEPRDDGGDECRSGRQKKKGKLRKAKTGKKVPMPNFQEGQGRSVCIQEYLEPFLLDGYKFDIRLYVMLTSVNPMKGFLCRVGMVRKAMVAYEHPNSTNIRQLHMHLTNTSLNSKFTRGDSSEEDDCDDSSEEEDEEDEDEEEEEDDEEEEDEDSEEEEEDDDDEPADCKRFLADVMWELGRGGVDTQALWQEITRIVQLTLNAIHPDVALSYSTAFQKSPANQELLFRNSVKKAHRKPPSPEDGGDRGTPAEIGAKQWQEARQLQDMLFSSKIDGDRCFQMMGFDIFLDKRCKPYIIEINHNPSFKLPTELDVEIKTAALAGCLAIVCDQYMPYPADPAPAKPHDGNVTCVGKCDVGMMKGDACGAGLGVAGSGGEQQDSAESEKARVDALEKERSRLFHSTGLGKRQQQQQEIYAPSSFTRAKSESSVDGDAAQASGVFARIPSVCKECAIPDGNGGHMISSRDWSLHTLYDCVGVPGVPLQVMDLARMLFEGICTKALLQSHKEAIKGLESAHQRQFSKPPKAPAAGKKPAIAFGSSSGTGSRRVGEYLNSGELRLQDYGLLQDLLSRARLPQACGTCIQMDNIRKLFVAKRTPAASVLQLDGFCDGLLSLAETITECLLGGGTEEVAPPKLSPEWQLDSEAWDLAQKSEGMTDLAYILHRLLGRMIATLTVSD